MPSSEVECICRQTRSTSKELKNQRYSMGPVGKRNTCLDDLVNKLTYSSVELYCY